MRIKSTVNKSIPDFILKYQIFEVDQFLFSFVFKISNFKEIEMEDTLPLGVLEMSLEPLNTAGKKWWGPQDVNTND